MPVECRRLVVNNANIVDRFDNGKFLILEGLPESSVPFDLLEINGRTLSVKNVVVGRLGRIGVELWNPL